MKFYILFLGSILSAITFLSSFPVNHITQQESFSLKDSLEKYKDSDKISIIQKDGLFTLSIGKANGHSYAFYVEGDSLTIFFQKGIAEVWMATDTLHYGAFRSYALTFDLNGDDYPDAVLSSATGTVHNNDNTVFIFNAKNNLYEHNRFYDLPNVRYNNNGKFVQSVWYGPIGCQWKEKYTIVADSLSLEMGISICHDNNKKSKTLEYYKIINNKKVSVKKITGSASKLWPIFNLALWNST